MDYGIAQSGDLGAFYRLVARQRGDQDVAGFGMDSPRSVDAEYMIGKFDEPGPNGRRLAVV